MTGQVTTNPEHATINGRLSVRKRILRYVVLIGASVGLGIGMTYGVAIFQERQQTHTRRAGIEGGFVRFSVESPPSPENFSPVQVVSPFPPITEVPVSTVEEAEAAEQKIDDDELVLGVVVNDEARAYPINMLTGPSREIMNDILGGRAIAATW